MEYANIYKPSCEEMEKDRAEMEAKYSAERLASLEITETNGHSNERNGDV
jgi:hypothetical protein